MRVISLFRIFYGFLKANNLVLENRVEIPAISKPSVHSLEKVLSEPLDEVSLGSRGSGEKYWSDGPLEKIPALKSVRFAEKTLSSNRENESVSRELEMALDKMVREFEGLNLYEAELTKFSAIYKLNWDLKDPEP